MDTVNIFNTELRNKIKVNCDLIPGVWVEFYDDLLLESIYKAGNKSDDPKENIDNNLDMLVGRIADWNFADENGLLPISIDTLKKIPMKLLNWLTTKSGECLNQTADKKKV